MLISGKLHNWLSVIGSFRFGAPQTEASIVVIYMIDWLYFRDIIFFHILFS